MNSSSFILIELSLEERESKIRQLMQLNKRIKIKGSSLGRMVGERQLTE